MSTDTTTTDDTDSTQDMRRNPSKRVFASELNDAVYQFKLSDDDRAPVWTALPTGESANRVFIAGTATLTEETGNGSMMRARINDGTDGGNFYVYGGEYNPNVESLIRQLETPAYVAAVGKINVYNRDDGDAMVSVRPEQMVEISKEQRREWIVETAEATFLRADRFEERVGDEQAMTNDMEIAADEYGDTIEQYREAAREALRAVAGEEPSDAPTP
ncbi:DNA-binding protein [Salinibaculum rarum]|uniref:DNA-binding protein n=1 Tax=Salinibaculum rarum TaxID=3058903 RepID=UPI0026601130|nr:DNA-binding protein [Salinibaculum sp. KK48]